MHLNRGHWVINYILKELDRFYKPDLFSFHGSHLLTEILQNKCGFNTSGVSKSVEEWITKFKCPDLIMLTNYTFIPVHYNDLEDILYETKIPNRCKNSYAVHTWSSLSHSDPIVFTSKKPYSLLANLHCPKTVAESLEQDNGFQHGRTGKKRNSKNKY